MERESHARVPTMIGVLVVAVLLVIIAVVLMHPFVSDAPRKSKPVDPAVTESDNRLTDTMTAAARIFIGSHDMRVIKAKALQDAVNGVPGTDAATHARPVRIVPMRDAARDVVAFATESKSRIVFVVFEAGQWMCLAYDPGAVDTISIGHGPTVAAVSSYTKCTRTADAST